MKEKWHAYSIPIRHLVWTGLFEIGFLSFMLGWPVGWPIALGLLILAGSLVSTAFWSGARYSMETLRIEMKIQNLDDGRTQSIVVGPGVKDPHFTEKLSEDREN